jgi:hypothetical protein
MRWKSTEGISFASIWHCKCAERTWFEDVVGDFSTRFETRLAAQARPSVEFMLASKTECVSTSQRAAWNRIKKIESTEPKKSRAASTTILRGHFSNGKRCLALLCSNAGSFLHRQVGRLLKTGKRQFLSCARLFE